MTPPIPRDRATAPCIAARAVTAALLAIAAGIVAPHAAVAACGPLPPPAGSVVRVTTPAELRAAVTALVSGQTILVAPGTYDLEQTIVLDAVVDVAIRGESGNRDDVVLRGRGMGDTTIPHGVLVWTVRRLLVADLTIRDVGYHAVQIAGELGPSEITLRNLRLVDTGEQHVKGSTKGTDLIRYYGDDVVIECSLIEYTDRAPSGYANGVDVLAGARWIVRDNVFRNIRAPVGELAGPAVLAWRNSLDTVVERNLFIDCDRGPALGLSAPDVNSRDGETVYDHQGGVVRNNVFVQSPGSATGDVGISVNYCRSFSVVHNTVLLNGTFPWTIEYRFPPTDGVVANNLTDGPVQARDGASATLAGNLTSAPASWFVDPAAGDAHLAAGSGAEDAADAAFPVVDDIDSDGRPWGAASDVGADERIGCLVPTEAVRNVRVRREGQDVVLTWTVVPNAESYHVWGVGDPSLASLLAAPETAPAFGIGGCSPPTPTPVATCRDTAAVGRDTLTCYGVRAACGGVEGP